MNEIILLSNGCPRCRILKQLLDNRGIHYTEENSVEKMLAMGIEQVPALIVDGELLDCNKAMAYVNGLEVINEKQ